ncbi:MAG: hypothetical protein JNK76_03590 [Planctomycetales bacterium]|nr:hypothetical protein [Planctomycetales bacterium]MBN8628669.1 hypothetical protein [Planctomycetota bacterium]
MIFVRRPDVVVLEFLETPRTLASDAFDLVREAARRAVGMRHFDVQLLGGVSLVSRGLSEMQTGKGKTLTATLPMYLFAFYDHDHIPLRCHA